jgi:fucose permease
LVSFGIALCNVVLLSTVFKFKTRDGKVQIFLGLALFNYAMSECFRMFGQQTTESTEDERSSLKPILRAKAVHFLVFFVLAYVGVEVTIGGWFLLCK